VRAFFHTWNNAGSYYYAEAIFGGVRLLATDVFKIFCGRLIPPLSVKQLGLVASHL
jgi:hypothetical protein